MIKKIALTILCSFMGIVFLISGYTKAGFPFPYSSPIEPFEFTFVDLGFINWQVAPFIARLMIGIEFTIGVLLLLNLNLRKLTYKLAAGTLLFFCLYLILLILFVGNKGNCGCFGDTIQMTPLQALLKNIIMLAIFFVLYKLHEGWQLPKKLSFVMTLIYASALAFPFVRNPIELNYSEAYLNKPEENFKLELDSLYNNAKLNIPPKTLSQGKHIIAFMSMSCPHCRIAAKKMRIIHERNPEIPLYFVLNGKDEKIKPFFDDTHSEDIPHCILNGRNFVFLAGVEMPRIYLINNSIVEHDMNYIDLDQEEIEKWLKK
ncbi:MAG: hypothetical protein NTX97_01560 [Bacteroidetes bacterium]|nr:hypothetical protein [Bacteroidota bacterium]